LERKRSVVVCSFLFAGNCPALFFHSHNQNVAAMTDSYQCISPEFLANRHILGLLFEFEENQEG
jgi:hypothetical protein